MFRKSEAPSQIARLLRAKAAMQGRPVLVRRTITRRPIAVVRRAGPGRPMMPPQRRGLLCRRIVSGPGGQRGPSGSVPPQIAAAFKKILAAKAMRPGPACPLGPRFPMRVNGRPMQG